MSVPISPTGNPDAKQTGSTSDPQSEDLGEGHIMGNLTADPELRYTPSGRAVTKLRVAWTPRLKNQSTGAYYDGPTEYYDLDVWGQQGERCAELLVKGDRIVATGSWTRRTWKDKDEQERQAHSLTARDIGPSLLFRGAQVDRTKPSGQAASHD